MNNKYYRTPKQTFLFEIYPYQNGYMAAIFGWNKDSQLIWIDKKYWCNTIEQVIYKIKDNRGEIENITEDEFEELYNKNK